MHVSSFQAMHFCYGLGAFVSPMIAEPFLLNEDCSPLIKEEENNPLNISMRSFLEPSVLDVNTTSELYPAETLEEELFISHDFLFNSQH